MITIKTENDIKILREGGKRHAEIMQKLVTAVHVGVSTKELDTLAAKLIKEGGDKSAFLGYRPDGADREYPATLCVSLNDAVVHGIPNEGKKVLKDGDIVSLDLGLIHVGRFTDTAVTVIVGNGDEKAKRLINTTRIALEMGIGQALAGGRVGDIGQAIESFVKSRGFSLAEDLAGHGVGFAVHEEPYVPNTGPRGKGPLLKPGMVIAIEPTVNEGRGEIFLDTDGYTYRTADGGRSAHFEHTVLITDDGPEVLTSL